VNLGQLSGELVGGGGWKLSEGVRMSGGKNVLPLSTVYCMQTMTNTDGAQVRVSATIDLSTT